MTSLSAHVALSSQGHCSCNDGDTLDQHLQRCSSVEDVGPTLYQRLFDVS